MPRAYPFELREIDGMIEMCERIKEIEDLDSYDEKVYEYSKLLKKHINTQGNNKISKITAIFNLNAAEYCPNKETIENGESETGLCQVPWEDCYAGKAERQYDAPLDYRCRQEVLWDCLDADTWALAFLEMVSRKTNPVDSIRFSEAGDFRSESDIIKVNRIAEIVGEYDIDVYTYSASHKLDWSESEHFTVNASNGLADYGDRRFMALDKDDELPENTVWCPFSLQTENGQTENRKKCGECRLCINPEGPNVAVVKH